MKKIRFVIRYIKYLFKSVNKQGVRSPFVYDLLIHVIDVKADYYRYKDVEKLREQLLDSDQKISFVDFGASALREKSSRKKK